MSSVETYPAAPPERIGVTYIVDGVLSGAGVWLDITRKSVAGASDAAEILDWADATFKAIGAAGTPIVSVPPVVGRTGDYRLDWNVGAVVNAVAGGDEYKVRFYSDAGGTTAIGSAEIRTRNVGAINANTDAATSPLATSAALATAQADLDNIQTRIPASLVDGRMDSSVGAMASDVITSSAFAASAVTEIGTGVWATVSVDGTAFGVALALLWRRQVYANDMTANGLLRYRAANGVTVEAQRTFTDPSGDPITALPAGTPARASAEAPP